MVTKQIDNPLRHLNSFHVEERADCIIEFDSASDLESLFSHEEIGDNWYVLGGGNNILFTKRYCGTLIKPIGKDITPQASCWYIRSVHPHPPQDALQSCR